MTKGVRNVTNSPRTLSTSGVRRTGVRLRYDTNWGLYDNFYYNQRYSRHYNVCDSTECNRKGSDLYVSDFILVSKFFGPLVSLLNGETQKIWKEWKEEIRSIKRSNGSVFNKICVREDFRVVTTDNRCLFTDLYRILQTERDRTWIKRPE